MSSIQCARCSEPWDSTGGLHYSHSDVSEEDYEALLKGEGCPCCQQNLESPEDAYAPEFIEAWQRSVEHLSEGLPEYMYETFNTQPKKVPLFRGILRSMIK